MPRTRDRQLAGLLLTLATAALVVAAAVTEVPPSRVDVFATDPDALEALGELLEARDRGSWLVDFAFERQLAGGGRREESVTEAQLPPVRVLVSARTASVDLGDRRVTCSETDSGPQCREDSAAEPTLPAASVYREAVERGVYAVREAAEREVAGERVRCFELVAVTGTLGGLGLVSEQCFARDGVPLWSRVAEAGATDTREARFVSRAVDRSDLSALLDAFAGDDALPLDSLAAP